MSHPRAIPLFPVLVVAAVGGSLALWQVERPSSGPPTPPTLPEGGQDRIDALGAVTVSTPIFSPMTGLADASHTLAFRMLRDEIEISKAVSRATASSQDLQYLMWRVGLGVSSDLSGLLRQGGSPDQAAKPQEIQRTDAAPLSKGAGIPSSDTEVQRRFAELSARSTNTFQMAPDDVATLVAAIKTYMLGLEDYYNAAPVLSVAQGGGWVPYRVYMTVAVEPGWYSEVNEFDAVTEIHFGDAANISCGKFIRVVSAVPLQTAQAIDELNAAFEGLGSALALGASAPVASAQAAMDRIRAAANRLEGIRTNTTFVASYPDSNGIRMRFRPSIVPNGSGRDLQPTSRVITAIVLIDNAAKLPTWFDPQPRLESELPESGASPAASPAAPARRLFGSHQEPTSDWAHGAVIPAGVHSWMAPGLRLSGGRLVVPKDTSRKELSNRAIACYVPAWVSPETTGPFGISAADGLYWESQGDSCKAAIRYSLRLPLAAEYADQYEVQVRVVGAGSRMPGGAGVKSIVAGGSANAVGNRPEASWRPEQGVVEFEIDKAVRGKDAPALPVSVLFEASLKYVSKDAPSSQAGDASAVQPGSTILRTVEMKLDLLPGASPPTAKGGVGELGAPLGK